MNPAEYEIMYRQESDHWWYRGLRAMIDRALDRLETNTPRILDAGCGAGANAQHLANRGVVTCLDLSPLALDKCRDRGLTRLVRASASALPFDAQRFDLVLMLDVLYHRKVPDPRAPLAEVRRALVPNGHLIVNVPAYQWLHARHDDAVHTARRFTRTELNALLQSAGFTVVQCTYWNSLLFPLIATTRLLNRGPSQTSDTDRRFPRPIERIFETALAAERRLMNTIPLPWGLSIFALAKK